MEGRRYAGMPVLVTGGQGFIGSWLVERLQGEGASVVVPLRHATEQSRFCRERLDQRCTLVRLDLLDPTSIWRVLEEHEVELVFHLAAQTLVQEASHSPLATFATNVRGTYNVLEACRLTRSEERPVRVVVASSYHAYGPHGGIAYTEELPLRPRYPYEVSKACADMIARSYAATFDMPVAVTRLANAYGGGDLNFSRLVPDASRAIAAGWRPVIRSDGTPERDYLYVEDAVDAYLAIADSLEDEGLWGRAWNAGSGTPVAVAELVRELIAAAGADFEPDIRAEPDPRAEIDRQYLDSTAIREKLGWQPRWGRTSGVGATWDWYARNLDRGLADAAS
jgi:CDP-glucose 4,6-dehydratase